MEERNTNTMEKSKSLRRRSRPMAIARAEREPRSDGFCPSSRVVIFGLLLVLGRPAWSFILTPSGTSTVPSKSTFSHPRGSASRFESLSRPSQSSSTTALNVWWFGGTETAETVGQDEDSCELVPVRIERTSSNSRRIYGEIVVPGIPIDDVWAILTDYDRLSTHVPNLVESKIVSKPSYGEPGDGSYQCRLFQKGAQKIVGFEFGASVTMDMKEYTKRKAAPPAPSLPQSTSASSTPNRVGNARRPARQQAAGIGIPSLFRQGRRQQGRGANAMRATTAEAAASLASSTSTTSPSSSAPVGSVLDERRITFKCADSFFFQEFDGEWKVQERVAGPGGENGPDIESVLSYVVDVRPKGPVPVAALEWRIREDVPTNLRAVKRAAIEEGYEGVMAYRNRQNGRRLPSSNTLVSRRSNGTQQPLQQQRPNQIATRPKKVYAGNIRSGVTWDRDETMAAYLDK